MSKETERGRETEKLGYSDRENTDSRKMIRGRHRSRQRCRQRHRGRDRGIDTDTNAEIYLVER